MARAQLTDIRSEITGDQMTLRCRVIFHGADVNPPDSDLVEVTLADTTTKAQARTAIGTAVRARATALGYSVGASAIYTLEELFAGV